MCSKVPEVHFYSFQGLRLISKSEHRFSQGLWLDFNACIQHKILFWYLAFYLCKTNKQPNIGADFKIHLIASQLLKHTISLVNTLGMQRIWKCKFLILICLACLNMWWNVYGLLQHIMISLYKNALFFQWAGGLFFLLLLPLPTVLLVACPYGRVFLCSFIRCCLPIGWPHPAVLSLQHCMSDI